MNLQNQIRQKFVDGIINGAFAPGMKLPSSRKLSRQLDIARNAGPRAGLSDLTGSMGKMQGLSATGRTNFE
jgi:DNA-binding FadR family transcriptional regulator